jgi:hypothetical protein
VLVQGSYQITLGPGAFSPDSPNYVLKFERAVEHLNTVTAEAAAFIEGDFNTPVGEECELLDDGWTILKWGEIKPVPTRWSLYLGDYLHNLRSALDHMIYAIAVANDHANPDNTQFPIYDALAKWVQDIEERDPTLKPSPVAGLPDEAVEDIKALQPFRHKRDKARKADPLMSLLRMSNADKHRRLYAAAIATGKITNLRFDPPGYVRILKKRIPPGGQAAKRGAEIARVKIEWMREHDTEVGARYNSPVQIAFGEHGQDRPTFTMAVLFDILNAVDKVGHALAPHLERGFAHHASQPDALPDTGAARFD